MAGGPGRQGKYYWVDVVKHKRGVALFVLGTFDLSSCIIQPLLQALTLESCS
jgi:hypothetical protein